MKNKFIFISALALTFTLGLSSCNSNEANTSTTDSTGTTETNPETSPSTKPEESKTKTDGSKEETNTETKTTPKPEVSLTGISTNSLLAAYNIGDTLTDVELILSYSDDTTKVITLEDSMVSGFDTAKAGSFTLTITYEGFKITHNYKVVDLEDALVKEAKNMLAMVIAIQNVDFNNFEESYKAGFEYALANIKANQYSPIVNTLELLQTAPAEVLEIQKLLEKLPLVMKDLFINAPDLRLPSIVEYLYTAEDSKLDALQEVLALAMNIYDTNRLSRLVPLKLAYERAAVDYPVYNPIKKEHEHLSLNELIERWNSEEFNQLIEFYEYQYRLDDTDRLNYAAGIKNLVLTIAEADNDDLRATLALMLQLPPSETNTTLVEYMTNCIHSLGNVLDIFINKDRSAEAIDSFVDLYLRENIDAFNSYDKYMSGLQKDAIAEALKLLKPLAGDLKVITIKEVNSLINLINGATDDPLIMLEDIIVVTNGLKNTVNGLDNNRDNFFAIIDKTSSGLLKREQFDKLIDLIVSYVGYDGNVDQAKLEEYINTFTPIIDSNTSIDIYRQLHMVDKNTKLEDLYKQLNSMGGLLRYNGEPVLVSDLNLVNKDKVLKDLSTGGIHYLIVRVDTYTLSIPYFVIDGNMVEGAPIPEFKTDNLSAYINNKGEILGLGLYDYESGKFIPNTVDFRFLGNGYNVYMPEYHTYFKANVRGIKDSKLIRSKNEVEGAINYGIYQVTLNNDIVLNYPLQYLIIDENNLKVTEEALTTGGMQIIEGTPKPKINVVFEHGFAAETLEIDLDTAKLGSQEISFTYNNHTYKVEVLVISKKDANKIESIETFGGFYKENPLKALNTSLQTVRFTTAFGVEVELRGNEFIHYIHENYGADVIISYELLEDLKDSARVKLTISSKDGKMAEFSGETPYLTDDDLYITTIRAMDGRNNFYVLPDELINNYNNGSPDQLYAYIKNIVKGEGFYISTPYINPKEEYTEDLFTYLDSHNIKYSIVLDDVTRILYFSVYTYGNPTGIEFEIVSRTEAMNNDFDYSYIDSLAMDPVYTDKLKITATGPTILDDDLYRLMADNTVIELSCFFGTRELKGEELYNFLKNEEVSIVLEYLTSSLELGIDLTIAGMSHYTSFQVVPADVLYESYNYLLFENLPTEEDASKIIYEYLLTDTFRLNINGEHPACYFDFNDYTITKVDITPSTDDSYDYDYVISVLTHGIPATIKFNLDVRKSNFISSDVSMYWGYELRINSDYTASDLLRLADIYDLSSKLMFFDKAKLLDLGYNVNLRQILGRSYEISYSYKDTVLSTELIDVYFIDKDLKDVAEVYFKLDGNFMNNNLHMFAPEPVENIKEFFQENVYSFTYLAVDGYEYKLSDRASLYIDHTFEFEKLTDKHYLVRITNEHIDIALNLYLYGMNDEYIQGLDIYFNEASKPITSIDDLILNVSDVILLAGGLFKYPKAPEEIKKVFTELNCKIEDLNGYYVVSFNNDIFSESFIINQNFN